MNITHRGRSETVKSALTDFGIEESFAQAAKRFKEHYNFEISISALDRATKESTKLAESFINKKLSESKDEDNQGQMESTDKMLIEIDGCEIRVAQ